MTSNLPILTYLYLVDYSCGGTHNGSDEGYIYYPGYRLNSYPNNAYCVWEIILATDYEQVAFRVPHYNIEKSDDCEKDYLTVRIKFSLLLI